MRKRKREREAQRKIRNCFRFAIFNSGSNFVALRQKSRVSKRNGGNNFLSGLLLVVAERAKRKEQLGKEQTEEEEKKEHKCTCCELILWALSCAKEQLKAHTNHSDCLGALEWDQKVVEKWSKSGQKVVEKWQR